LAIFFPDIVVSSSLRPGPSRNSKWAAVVERHLLFGNQILKYAISFRNLEKTLPLKPTLFSTEAAFY